MIPQIQLTKTDCLRTCLACLLDMQAKDVPDFAQKDSWWEDMQSWLAERGLFFLEVRIGGSVTVNTPPEFNEGKGTMLAEIFTIWNPIPFPALAVFAYTTANGGRHMIIGTCEGGEFVPQFDPRTGKSFNGTTQPESVCFLVPRDPGIYARFGRSMERIEKLSDVRIHSAGTLQRLHEIQAIARESLDKPITTLNGSSHP